MSFADLSQAQDAVIRAASDPERYDLAAARDDYLRAAESISRAQAARARRLADGLTGSTRLSAPQLTMIESLPNEESAPNPRGATPKQPQEG